MRKRSQDHCAKGRQTKGPLLVKVKKLKSVSAILCLATWLLYLGFLPKQQDRDTPAGSVIGSAISEVTME